jgi:hypothetical protein
MRDSGVEIENIPVLADRVVKTKRGTLDVIKLRGLTSAVGVEPAKAWHSQLWRRLGDWNRPNSLATISHEESSHQSVGQTRTVRPSIGQKR